MAVKRTPKRLSDLPTYTENPSVGAGITKWIFPTGKDYHANRKSWSDEATGELIVELTEVGGERKGNVLVDTKQFIKFFKESSSDVRKLNASAIKVLMYIFEVVEKEQDVVVLEYEKAKLYYEYMREDLGCSDDTFRSGVYDLLKHELIYRKVGVGNEYFVNVNKFFLGKRTNLQAFKEINEKLKIGKFIKEFDVEGDKRLQQAEDDKRRYARMNAGIKELKRK